MEYTITIQVPDTLVSRAHITDMNAFANKAIQDAMEREALIVADERDEEEKAFNNAVRSQEFKSKVGKLENILDNVDL